MEDILGKCKKILSNIFEFIKNNKVYFIVSLLVFILILGILIGKSQNSKDDLLKKLEVALKENNRDELEDILSKDKLQVDMANLYHLLDYYKEDSLRVDNTISKLKQNNETDDFELTSEEGMFGDKYKLYIKAYNLKINSNYEEGCFSIDDKTISSGAQFIHLVPGVYKIDGNLKGKYGDINSEKEILLMKDEEVKINFDAMDIKVKSEFQDAKILINGKDTGMIVKDDKMIGPVSKDGSVTVAIRKEFPWGEVTSSPIKVANSSEINVPINIENKELVNELAAATDEFYRSVFKALNQEDKSCIESASEEAKNKIYQVLENKYILFKNNYEITDVSIQDGKNDYSYTDNTYTATVVVILKYKVKSLFGIVSDEYEKDFFTTIKYADGKWIVSDVENFNL